MSIDDRIAKASKELQAIANELMELPPIESVEQAIDFRGPDIKIDAYYWHDAEIEDIHTSMLIDLLNKVSSDEGDDPFGGISFRKDKREKLDTFKLRVLAAMLIRTHHEWSNTYSGIASDEALENPLAAYKDGSI